MKTIFNSYNLETNGKVLTVSIKALLRAVGLTGAVTSGVLPASALDTLKVGLEIPGVTGVRILGNEGDTRVDISGDTLTISVAKLPAGVSRLFVFGQYGTNCGAMLICDLHVPQNVPFLDADGAFTPLVRYATKDATSGGTNYYAYAYKHGEVLVWFDSPVLNYKEAVTCFVADDLEATLADADEDEGIVVNNANVAVYDVPTAVNFGAVDTVGGGGEQNLMVGTQAERLALVNPKEGLEFNQVNYNTETEVYTVQRYIRENGAWVELESPQTELVETVSLHVTTWDGLGTVTGLAVGVTDNNTEVIIQRTLDENGNCTFDIVKGHTYTISVASLSGYRDIPDQTYAASLDERSITLTFQKPQTNYETVQVHVTVYNQQLQDVTAQDTAMIGKTITCQIQGGQPLTAQIGADHTCTFQVLYGETYTIEEPQVAGFMRRFATSWTHVASVPMRTIPMHYVIWANVGIYGIDDAGATYTHEDIAAMTTAERANIKFIGVNTSRLQSAGASFMYKLPVATQSKQWAASNVEFDQTLLPFKQNHAAAVLDLNGSFNTQKIIEIGDTMGVGTPAADYCVAQTITVGGVTKNGFLGAYGQMYALSENITELAAIHTLLGVAAPGFTSGYWWTSTQYNATNAVHLGNGGFNGNHKNSNYTTVALFAL